MSVSKPREIHVYLSASEHKALKALAEKEGRSLSKQAAKMIGAAITNRVSNGM